GFLVLLQITQKCCVSVIFLFSKTVETHQYVIASQCAHWRGNPFPRHLKKCHCPSGQSAR
ncbi:MAG: hypothetical protein IJO28_08955, partial [Oscillospiraceae bacterium]|nr:hypothetical protein [Oscillospiraceae bacterium]